MQTQLTSLARKREVLIANNIIKGSTLENTVFQRDQPHGFGLNLCGHCLFRCSYCPESINSHPKEFISMKVINQLLDDTQNVPTYFQLGTRGDYLLHPNCFEILDKIRNNNDHHFITLNSNGWLLTEKNATKIITCKVDQLTFSLQSINPQIYTSLTNNKNMDRVLKNIKKTIHIRDSLNSNMMIGIQFLDSKENRIYYNDFENYFAPYNVYLYKQPLHCWGGKIESEHQNPIKRYPCLYLWLYPNISHKGKVSSCFADFYDEQSFGDLHHQSLSEIWQTSPERKKLQQLHLSSKWDETALCKNCSSWQFYENIFIQDDKQFYLPDKGD